jgi:hypothetical protein
MNESQRLLIAIIALFGAITTEARGAELCFLAPQGIGEWHYRTKIGGRPERCWYIGERMKPRSELYWAEIPKIPPLSIMDPPESNNDEFNLRWKGETR